MKTVNYTVLMGTACLGFLPLLAHSEVKMGNFEGSLFGGYHLFDTDQNLVDRSIWGGRLGYHLTHHFGLEGVVEMVDSSVDDRQLTATRKGQFSSPTHRVDLLLYHIDALYHFMPDRAFNPYLVAGIGGINYSPDISYGIDMATINLGIGAKYWLTRDVAIRIDLRDYLVSELFEESYSSVALTAGLTFAFDSKPKSRSVAPELKAEQPVLILVSEPEAEQNIRVIAAEQTDEKRVIIIALEEIYFEFDKSTLTQEARNILKKNIQILKENPKIELRIAGYTSVTGTEEYNQKLSERRAHAVSTYLIEAGLIQADRLETIGYGETRQVAPKETAPLNLYSRTEKANMRVLFEIILQ